MSLLIEKRDRALEAVYAAAHSRDLSALAKAERDLAKAEEALRLAEAPTDPSLDPVVIRPVAPPPSRLGQAGLALLGLVAGGWIFSLLFW